MEPLKFYPVMIVIIFALFGLMTAVEEAYRSFGWEPFAFGAFVIAMIAIAETVRRDIK